MGHVLFETKEINTAMAIVLLLVSVMLLCLFICLSINLCYKRKIKQLTSFYVFTALTFLLIFSLYCLVQVPMQKKDIYDKYKSGDFFTEEGNVYIIYNDDNIEEYYFVINEITFSLDNRQAYNFSCKDNELCVYDGQYIKVSYVKYRGKNLIMKIEEAPH